MEYWKIPNPRFVQTAIKHQKIDENQIFQFFKEKLNLDLSFAQGFIKIHQLARFL